MNNDTTIPLFPLGLVLFPGMPLPLHIFEERYKLMVEECMAEDREFGVVLFGGKGIRDFGCTAKIEKVLKEFPDGKSDIMVVGRKRFFIRRLIHSKPYLQAAVAFFDDAPETATAEWEEIATKGINLLWHTESVPPKEESLRLLKSNDYKGVSFMIAGSEGFTPEEKQVFLEMTSTFQRLQKGTGSLEKIIQRNLLTFEIHTIIGGNGNVRKYFKVS